MESQEKAAARIPPSILTRASEPGIEQVRRLVAASQRAGMPPEAVNAVNDALEELAVVQEELRLQNERLGVLSTQLETERRRYHDLFELAPDGYLVTDLAGVVREANLAAGSLLGVSPEHLVGKPLAVYVDLNDRHKFRYRLLALRLEGAPRTVELRLQPRSGPWFWASLSAVASRDDRGAAVAFRWQLRDVTRRVEAEAQVRRLNTELGQQVIQQTAELRRAYEHQKEYLRMITHDLRQPLTVLQGMAQLAESAPETASSARQRRISHTIGETTRRLASMISDLAATVSLDSGDVLLARERLCLDDFLSQVVESAFPEDQRSRLRLQLPVQGAEVNADRNYLERAVVNLIGNALKYSPPDEPVDIGLEVADGRAIVSIADKGSGIPEEDLPHLFQRYYRSYASRKVDGLGLGLYIARLAVEAHGGNIWVASEDGKGCTFSISLPLAE